MPLTIHQVNQEETAVLDNLLQLYLHETSMYSPKMIEETGRYDTTIITDNIKSGALEANLVRIKGYLAGFIITQPRIQNGEIVTRSVSDLFILHNYRGFGIGEEVARLTFDQAPGLWHIEIQPQFEEATKFWTKVIYRYTGDNFRHLKWQESKAEIFEFRSPAARPSATERAPIHIQIPQQS
jgi:predicted acetyltransferase